MAAGLGFKTFATGEVLTAADTNGYLMQGVLVFASAAARNSAITSPQEGQYCYLKDTNSTEYYDGAAWVSGVEGDISGVTAGTGISGGGTSGTVTVTNSMATAIDAKGDLVPGTGADTFARLAVGTNGQLLSADSTAATGLAWSNGGTSTSYTPTWGVVSGTAPVLGNGSLTGKYSRIGDFVYFNIVFVAGTTTTFGVGSYTFTLPFTMSAARNGIAGDATALDAGVAWYRGYTPITAEANYTDKFQISNPAGSAFSNTSPFTFANTDVMIVWGSYVI